MCILDPFNNFPHALGRIHPVRTAAGAIYRQVAVGAIRLINANGHGYLGGWFPELFGIEADIPRLGANGVPVVDGVGNIEFEDFRLTGQQFRCSFFKGSGKQDGRLVLSTVKSLLQPNPPA